jgi:MFS family permease
MDVRKFILSFKNNFKIISQSLKSRNYRLFFIGQGVSLIGTWMQVIALSWLVYDLTNSALLLGLVGFFSQVPSFFIAPFSGVLVDRWNRHRILIATQALSMIQAFILAFLTLSGKITILQVILLSLGLGLINAFDMPARQAFVIEMVEKRSDLANAIALNSSMVNSARLIGPAIAGILVAAVGEGFCFLINGITFMAVIFSLLAMRLKKKSENKYSNNILHDIKEGFRYSFGFIPIRSILLFLGLVSFIGMPYTVLMPIFAKDILHGGPNLLGYLMSLGGIGALLGGIYLASRKTVVGLGRILAVATGIFGISLILFSTSRILWLSLLMMLVSGFGMIIHIAASNTILQTITEDDKRGRVMSFFTMAFMGMTPFGTLLEGALANWIGAANTVLISGGICILGTIIFSIKLPMIREIVRPIYIKKGIISEIARGVQVASDAKIPPKP